MREDPLFAYNNSVHDVLFREEAINVCIQKHGNKIIPYIKKDFAKEYCQAHWLEPIARLLVGLGSTEAIAVAREMRCSARLDYAVIGAYALIATHASENIDSDIAVLQNAVCELDSRDELVKIANRALQIAKRYKSEGRLDSYSECNTRQ